MWESEGTAGFELSPLGLRSPILTNAVQYERFLMQTRTFERVFEAFVITLFIGTTATMAITICVLML